MLTELDAASQAPRGKALSVAVVEDDPLLRQEVELHLLREGFIVQSVNSASALDDWIVRQSFDLFVVDLNLPGENGLSLCKRLRQSMPQAGIVIMTARIGIENKIAGYEDGGADFYLTKPVSPRELVMVLQGLGRRIQHESSQSAWLLSLRERTLTSPDGHRKIRITAKEKAILLALAQAKDRTLPSGDLCDLCIDAATDAVMSKHALEELIKRLRKKFADPAHPQAESIIKSVWGVGYQLCISVTLSN